MDKIIIVTGIPGTGKTTVCAELLRLVEPSKRKIRVINFGSVMVKLSHERGGHFHRDELRTSKLFFQRELQTATAKLIAKKIEEGDGDTIIDTHMIIKTQEGYWAGLPLNALQFINPDNLVLIEAEPSEVLHRRFKDTTRRRDQALESGIVEEFSFSRFVAASCAVVTGASIKIIKNNDGKKVEAAKEIIGLLE